MNQLKIAKLFAINWFGMATAEWNKLIEQHKTDLIHLNDTHYWRSKHTDQEIEMRKHPNRGMDWIGTRLEEVRSSLLNRMLDLIVGRDQHLPVGAYVYSHERVPCMMCGLTDEEWWDINEEIWNLKLPEGSSYSGIPWQSSGHCPSCWENTIWPRIQTHIWLSTKD